MFTLEVIHSKEQPVAMRILFPKEYKVKPAETRNLSNQQVAKFLEINILKFIISHLKRYVALRERSYIYTNTYTSKRRMAIDRINHVLSTCEETRLQVATYRIANLQLSLSKIRPHPLSRDYNLYDTKIWPILQWCIEHAENRHQTPLKRNTM